jgi:hypothetical protein
MKITIDFDNKLITIEQEIIIQDLINKLNSLNINLNEYKILVNTQYIYTSPYYNQPISDSPYNKPTSSSPYNNYTDNIKLGPDNTEVMDNWVGSIIDNTK